MNKQFASGLVLGLILMNIIMLVVQLFSPVLRQAAGMQDECVIRGFHK